MNPITAFGIFALLAINFRMHSSSDPLNTMDIILALFCGLGYALVEHNDRKNS